MVKKQASLDSFFGGGAAKKSTKKKKTKKSDSEQKENAAASNSEKESPSPNNKRKETPQVSTADAEASIGAAATKSSSSSSSSNKRRRRVIDDDSSDEDEPAATTTKTTTTTTKPEAMDVDDNDDKASKKEKKEEEDEEEEKKPAASPKPAQGASKKEEDADNDDEEDASDDEEEEDTKAAKKSAKPASNSSASKKKKPATSSAKKGASKKAGGATTKAAVAAAGHKSNETLCKQLPWPTDQRMPYTQLCRVFSEIEAITGRLEIQERLTTLFRQILLSGNPQDIYAAVYLASNSVAPASQNVELGIGDSLLIKAIGEATGTNANMVKSKYEAVGDLGTVAQSFKGKQKTLGGFFTKKKAAGLEVHEILRVFREIASTKGNQSQKWKVDKIKGLLVKCTDPTETRYIIRGLQGKLRIGVSSTSVIISLAHALALTGVQNNNSDDDDSNGEKKGDADKKAKSKKEDNGSSDKEDDPAKYPTEAKQYMDPKQPAEKRLEAAVAIVKKAYMEVPSYDTLLDAALEVPLEKLHQVCTLQPGIPVSPMLAKPTKSIQEVLKRLNGQRFTCEYKYDGERAQVHLLPDGTTKVFSRNLLDTSEKYPEVPGFVQEAAKAAADKDNKLQVTSCVMDAEVVAFNNKTGQLVPFQILSTRKKTQESGESAKVQVILQAFDLMYLNGESLLLKTLSERRALLHQHFGEVPGKFQFATALDHTEDGNTAVLEEFLDQAVKGQCEGLMVKTLDDELGSIYEPARRSLNWLKIKKDYLEGLGDSVDLVVLGAYHGKGKRTGVYGAYLLACFDPDTEEFQSVCKIGTGFSDEDLQQLTKTLNEHVIDEKSAQYNVTDALTCDVWFDAVHVWEVKAADLSTSSAHRGAAGKVGGGANRGIGLRFPRFERVREDKKPEEATTSDQILEMYYQQDSVVATSNNDDDEDDDDEGI